ncbi:hypothetical protein DL96DRAFT_1614382 [Flagelloscypha sp. PMI_526]|nr:hypothetical protein DL96DRAFT_1614382 [Flagelloscypha sp. PMI_526]
MSDSPNEEFYILSVDRPNECFIFDLPSFRAATNTPPHPKWTSTTTKDKVTTISTGDGKTLGSTKIAEVTWSDENVHLQDGSEPVKILSWMKPESKLAKFMPGFSRCFPAKLTHKGKTYTIRYFKDKTMLIYADATSSTAQKSKALATYNSSFLKATSADKNVPLQLTPATIIIGEAVSTQSEKDLLVAMILTIEQKCRTFGKGLPPGVDGKLYTSGGRIDPLNYGSALVWGAIGTIGGGPGL